MGILGNDQGYSSRYLIKSSSEWGGSASGALSMSRAARSINFEAELITGWPKSKSPTDVDG